MKIKHTINNGYASVEPELGRALIATDLWKEVKDAPARKPAAVKSVEAE